MTYIYFDESGCLGVDFSKPGTKKHLLITFLILNECRPIISLVKKVSLTLPETIRKRRGSELHAHHEKHITKKRFLSGLAKKDVRIATMRLDKRKIVLIGNANDLYTNMVVSLINRLYADGVIKDNDDIKFVASRRNTSKKLDDEFSESIANHTNNVNFETDIVKACDDKCLQAVDFVSWALWQKYEMSDETYSDIVADKIVKEYVMYE